MPVIYSNNASTTLSSGINDSVTTVPIASASGFPSIGGGEYYFGTIANTNNTKIEVVKVTAGTTSLTVVRGQDGTTAQAFDSGDNFQLRVTAATLEAASKSDVNITGGAIAGAAITNDVIDSQHYATGSIDNEHIADDAIDSEHYADGSIDLAHMSSESVDEDNLYISNAGSNGQFLSKQSGNNGGLTWATPTDTNTNQLTTFTVSATTDTTATTISQGDDLMFTAGTGISCETTADGTVTITNTVSDTNTMGSGFTVSATTDSNATTITQGDDLMFTAGTGITTETTADGTVTIASTITGGIASLVADTTPQLGGALDGQDNTVSKINLKDYGIVTNAVGGGGGTLAIDLTAGNSVTATVETSTTTFTFSNPTASDELCIFSLVLTNGGSQTVVFPASVDWEGGTAPTLQTSGTDILVFATVDGGTIWHGQSYSLDSKSP